MLLWWWVVSALVAAARVVDQAVLLSTPNHGTIADRKGAVASENSICSNIGIDLLRDGGNAADALVGTVFCVGVIGMYHSGTGGGGFAIVRSSNGSYEYVDFRESAPAAAFEDMFKDNVEGSLFGGLASGVPGDLRGLEYIHKNYGRLPWAAVLAPSIRVARYGFPVTEDLVRYMDFATREHDFLTLDPTWAIDFAPNGTRVKLGDCMTRKRYADTLENISENGADSFYSGAMAEATIVALAKTNGTMALSDLEGYKVVIRKPVEISYRGFKLTSCSSPAGGTVALATLKIVEGYNMGSTEGINLTTHRLDEAMRFAYGQRVNLGDPDFLDDVEKYEQDMLSEKTAAHIRSRISDRRTQNVSAYDPLGLEIKNTLGTSHIVAADSSGLAISLTSTLNLIFGSQVMVPETGVIMNNEMNDFSIPGTDDAFGYIPSPANFIRPGKRPLSSIAATIVEHANGTLYFVVGAAGGSRIITATIQNLWHVLDRNATAPSALAEPRLHDQLIPNQVTFEYAYNNDTVAFMKGRGHNVTWVPPGYSAAQAIRRLSNGTFEAAGEPRQMNSGGFAI